MADFNRILSLTLLLCLLTGLCGCGAPSPAPSPSPSPTPSQPTLLRPTAAPPVGALLRDIPGELAAAPEDGTAGAAPEQTAAASETLSGRYYNDYLHETLLLSGDGTCTLTGNGLSLAGSWSAGEDGALTLDWDGETERAAASPEGDLLLDGRTGYFLHDWLLWGITAQEAGVDAAPVPVASSRMTVSESEDGLLRYRDFDNAIAFTCPSDMTVLNGKLIGGVAVSDGAEGYVGGRNVTDIHSTHSGSEDDFLEDYLRTFVFTDFGLLYGGVHSYAHLELLHEGVPGRAAAATLSLTGDSGDVFCRVILYTSTFSDGTVNYICKTVFAPASDADGIERLSNAVSQMSALRVRE